MSAERITVSHACDSAAPPAAVFALLADSSTYPEWSQVHSYRMERPGFDAPHGVGEIRVLSSRWGLDVREEIVETIPDRLMAYTLLSGLPMRDYRGETLLDPLPGGGTRIVWTSSFRPVPGLGWVMQRFMKWVLSTLSGSLARAAETRSTSAAAPAAAAAQT